MITDFSEELLKEIGDFIGIEEISFNQDGFCILQLQDQFAFILRHDQETERFIMIAEFATLKKISSNLFSSILSFHFLRIAQPRPWIALDQETGVLFLAEEFYLQATTKENFKERLVQFFEEYMNCQGLFNAETVEDLLGKESLSLLQSQELA
ncbi:MAG: type III secretion system chaperone [Chthoniobacterales bacterium]|nr:type III secretion system chaperone [Chthoniobacterales bacterium]